MKATDTPADRAYAAYMRCYRQNNKASFGTRKQALEADAENRKAWNALIAIISPQRSCVTPAVMALHRNYRLKHPA